MVAVFVSFFYCEKRQKNTFKKVLTYQFIEFSIGHIEKQQTKKPVITPVKIFTFVGKNTRRRVRMWVVDLLVIVVAVVAFEITEYLNRFE